MGVAMSIFTLVVLSLALFFVIFLCADWFANSGSKRARETRIRVFDDFDIDEWKRSK